MSDKTELLMPAGNLEKMRYAYHFGADAVYAGAPQFSLRTRENGFKEDDIFEGVQYANKLGKKFYLAANILAHNRKIKPFLHKIDRMMEAKPHALIMADPGLIDIVKNKHPEVDIHLSVQANAMNWATAKFWHKLGISRIILSRELSIDEIKEIKDNCPEMELEAFVHGAICIAHSGRCLLSNYFNFRDANDGTCTNACRWPYKLYSKKDFRDDDLSPEYDIVGDFYLEEQERPGNLMRIDEDEYGTYIMNARDLKAIEYLQQMTDAGVDSFKVEGRTKSIYYVSVVAKAYRQAIDEVAKGKEVSQQWIDELNKIHHRGYTPGFLTSRNDHTLQRYDEGLSNEHAQEFGGVVEDSRQGEFLMTPRNKLVIGDKIEIMTPDKSIHVVVDQMIADETGEPCEAIHGGTQKAVWIKCPDHLIPKMSLVSRVRTQKTFSV